MSQNLHPIIEIKGLTKNYNGKTVVNDLNLNIEDSCFALLGPNGAGKTTTILMLLGLVKPTNGNAFILGKNIEKGINQIRNQIGFLPENVGFYSKVTGREHLKLILQLREKIYDVEKEVESLLKWSGIEEEYWDKNVKTYSRGMRQRLGLTQAFAGNPKVIFLDEPLSNIDPLGRDDLINKIRLKKKQGMTIVISSHIIPEIEQLADSIAFIDKGNIIKSGSFYELAEFCGFNEYEINRINYQTEISLSEVSELLVNEVDLIIDKPQILTEKLIFKTQFPEKVNVLIEKFGDFNLIPLPGTLIRVYKKFFKGDNSLNEKKR